MELDQALAVINEVLGAFRGTRAEHVQIQTAFQVVHEACTNGQSEERVDNSE